ncbi:MAG TPA: helix-turn-helix domain-containing protein [Gemmatimonadaceae bacterium]|nr:helix-turn-helix domain-containing protein [Gemmatimonadaceae bacterium]
MYTLRKSPSEVAIVSTRSPQKKPPAARVAQRRRTRRAIVDAAGALLAEGRSPTVNDVAERAEVSRRTVYMYFPKLEQLLIDAALGSMSSGTVDAALDDLDARGVIDAEERIDALARAIQSLSIATEQQGRTIMRLTADVGSPGDEATPRRGYRRVEWIERALAPARKQLTPARFERLVSAISMVIGFEAFVVQRDIRGLSLEAATELSVWTARALVRATFDQHRNRTRRPSAGHS